MFNDSSVEWYDVADDLQKSCFSTKFQWKIEKFSSLPKDVDTFYESPEFSSPCFSWCLRLFPNGESLHSSEGWIGLYLVRCDDPGFGFICEVDCIVGIQNIIGTVELQKGIYKTIISAKNGKGWTKFLEKDALVSRKSEFYPSDVLTISIWVQHKISDNIEYEILTKKIGNIRVGSPLKENSDFKGLNMLIDSLKNSFLNKEDCDIIFNVRGKNIPAHKVILKARSKGLSLMLMHEMTKDSNVIKIHDCEPEAFEIFLLYLYTGKLKKLSDINMLEVLYIAEKYSVADLKAECISYIKCSMSVKNICNILLVAKKHSDSELLECATDYFVKNVHEILRSGEWKSFLKGNPKYGNIIYEKAVKKLEV